MKNYLISSLSFLLPFIASAHGLDETVMEESGISHQLQELLPFVHMNEGHWFAVILSLILWASLAYTAYSLVKKLTKTS